MVDGDEARMRRCGRTVWSGRDPVLFYYMLEMLNVKPAKQYQNLPAGEIGRQGNCSRNKLNLQERRLFLITEKN